VEEGVLDLEKAEEIKQKIDESDAPFPYRAEGKMMERRLMRVKKLDAASDFLGVSEEDIQKARLDGLTIEEIVEQNGKTMEEMHEYMEEKFGADELGRRGFGKE
ncbi:MAG: hypothetical protein U9Q67_00175, partial [Patescibacteria group bacterium]|nr:hypothetical protein [Patescibacteria group bacterium]